MEKQQSTVTISKEEFLRYYEMDKALHGVDIKNSLIYFREGGGYYDSNFTISILNPDEAARIMVDKNNELTNKINQLDFSLKNTDRCFDGNVDPFTENILADYRRVKNKWWFKLFYK